MLSQLVLYRAAMTTEGALETAHDGARKASAPIVSLVALWFLLVAVVLAASMV